jgi:hypothetical protein
MRLNFLVEAAAVQSLSEIEAMMGQFMSGSAVQPVDRSATKPVYLVIVDHPTSKKIQYFKISNLNEFPNYLEVRGIEITKAQAERLIEDPRLKIAGTEVEENVPWQYVKRIKNLKYKLKTGENNV